MVSTELQWVAGRERGAAATLHIESPTEERERERETLTIAKNMKIKNFYCLLVGAMESGGEKRCGERVQSFCPLLL